MEKSQLIKWSELLFIPAVKAIGGEHILVLDGHSSHVSLKVNKICKENNIRLACLPALFFISATNVSDKHFHKSKRNNIRIEGGALNEAETMEKVRAMSEK